MALNAVVRHLGCVDYEAAYIAMRQLTDSRTPETADELWFLQHPPVFTLGLNADDSHVLDAGTIPVVPADRGGQVTYHGPGQLVVYTLLNLRRMRINIRQLVSALEDAVIDMLDGYGIEARSRRDAPGVYVQDAKIASVGLRVRKGCCYHGLALNVSNDLSPFGRINTCGFPDLGVTRLKDLGGPADPEAVAPILCGHLLNALGLSKDPSSEEFIVAGQLPVSASGPTFQYPSKFH